MYNSYLSLYGDETKYSIGLRLLTANRHLNDSGYHSRMFLNINDNYGNGKAMIQDTTTGKWFLDSYSSMQARSKNGCESVMLGAICGDVAGSVYEHHNVKYCIDSDKLIAHFARFTDDSVMTIAVAEGIHRALNTLGDNWLEQPDSTPLIFKEIQTALLKYGNLFPHAGYGGSFRRWLCSQDPQPYNSWGNGSAMRASYAGWAAQSLAEAERLGEISAMVTHNHPEGIKGAQAVAGGIYTLRFGTKEDFQKYIREKFYEIDFTLDEIRENYHFDVSCQGSVPQAIEAFLEGENFAEVLSKAISIGGDSDTIAAIAGSFAEVIYPIPEGIRGRVIDRLDRVLRYSLIDSIDALKQPLKKDNL